MFLASNGSTVVLVPLLHVIYGITTLPGFYPVRFDNQVHIPRFDKDPLPEYSPDGKFLHVSLPKTSMSEFGMYEQAKSLQVSNVPDEYHPLTCSD